MGGILGAITGSKKATKTATKAANVASDQNAAVAREGLAAINQRLDPYSQGGTGAMALYNNLLGVPGWDGAVGQATGPVPGSLPAGAGESAFQNYLNNFGFSNDLREGSQAIIGNMASRRLLGSGATLKGLQRFGVGLRDNFRGNYLNALGNQQALGLNAATAGAGAQTNYTGQIISNNNNRASVIGNAALAGAANNTNFLGSAISAAAMLSDERTKENIVQIGQLDEGPGIYSYNYKGSDAPQVGVLAQEAELYRPDAVTTGSDGLKRVNYLALTHRRAA